MLVRSPGRCGTSGKMTTPPAGDRQRKLSMALGERVWHAASTDIPEERFLRNDLD